MYLCVAEATKVIVRAVKPTANTDKTHIGQFEYSIWIRLIRDSAEMIMRHGLFSRPRTVIEIVCPELNAFYLQWTQPTKEIKAEVDAIVKKYVCSESETLNKRGAPLARTIQ